MNKYLVFVMLSYSTSSFSWSITDKLLYDSYSSCLNHKLKDLDISKSNIAIARQAFSDDCKKAFCVEKREVTNDEYNLCKEIACKKSKPSTSYLGKPLSKEETEEIEQVKTRRCDTAEEYCRKEKFKDSSCDSYNKV